MLLKMNKVVLTIIKYEVYWLSIDRLFHLITYFITQFPPP